jgi:hypothetical protein
VEAKRGRRTARSECRRRRGRGYGEFSYGMSSEMVLRDTGERYLVATNR